MSNMSKFLHLKLNFNLQIIPVVECWSIINRDIITILNADQYITDISPVHLVFFFQWFGNICDRSLSCTS